MRFILACALALSMAFASGSTVLADDHLQDAQGMPLTKMPANVAAHQLTVPGGGNPNTGIDQGTPSSDCGKDGEPDALPENCNSPFNVQKPVQ